MHGRHQLAVGVERLLVDTRNDLLDRRLLDAVALGKCDQRRLGRITDLGAVRGDRCIVAEHEALDERIVCGLVEGIEVEIIAVLECLDDGHFVLRQGAGLIRADVADRAQRLDGRHILHDGVDFRHALHTERQHDGHDCGDTLRDRRHGEGYGSHEELQLLSALNRADQEHDCADHDDRDAESAAQLVHALLEGGRLVLFLSDHVRDLADLRVHAGVNDLTDAASEGHNRCHVRQIQPVTDAGLFVGNEVLVLLDGDGFARQRLFVHHQACRFEELEICGNLLARLEDDNITDNELL